MVFTCVWLEQHGCALARVLRVELQQASSRTILLALGWALCRTGWIALGSGVETEPTLREHLEDVLTAALTTEEGGREQKGEECGRAEFSVVAHRVLWQAGRARLALRRVSCCRRRLVAAVASDVRGHPAWSPLRGHPGVVGLRLLSLRMPLDHASPNTQSCTTMADHMPVTDDDTAAFALWLLSATKRIRSPLTADASSLHPLDMSLPHVARLVELVDSVSSIRRILALKRSPVGPVGSCCLCNTAQPRTSSRQAHSTSTTRLTLQSSSAPVGDKLLARTLRGTQGASDLGSFSSAADSSSCRATSTRVAKLAFQKALHAKIAEEAERLQALMDAEWRGL